ncbi:M48 family metallopeptidase [Tessaracoccus antarcticus]|nr:SprT family zinc-dependent metalloprotease [Tessaracoccus antarcticus]
MDGTTVSDLLQMDGYDAVVTYKAMKRLRLRILPPDGAVAISAPFGTPEHVIEQFVDQHHGWILRTRTAVRLRSPRPQRLDTGGRVRLWGAWTELVVEDASRAYARHTDGRVHILCPDGDEDAARRALDALHRRELEPALKRLLEEWQPRVGRRAAGIRMRRMTSRWGSCNTATAVITFNTALAKFPPEALEFVVVHELVHLLERGHGPVFKAHMSRLLPDWQARRMLLREGP